MARQSRPSKLLMYTSRRNTVRHQIDPDLEAHTQRSSKSEYLSPAYNIRNVQLCFDLFSISAASETNGDGGTAGLET
ncbi:hypothetical protein CBOM_07330 [Ceraceosorus bombacis]|uniref:Uncharacterized protein n=1 Tax=Ceraceosorus bombacis TaxID=401625 RepID=A0A0P1A3V6_9BASI|nr:hypothetical protein CBOM_07330 [Ceraceosorus bombacis]